MTSSPPPENSIPKCLNGLFNFDSGCVLVEDADEEIMELYMSLLSTLPESKLGDGDNNSGGLGFLNSNESILELSIDLTPPQLIEPLSSNHGSDKRGSKRKVKSIIGNKKDVESINVKIGQDLGMLKGQGGDTGSVLWRSSLYLSTQILRQSHHPTSYPMTIFDPDILKNSSILELGSGTGLLTILLSQLSLKYTSSDRLENLKLVKRNLELNGILTMKDIIVEGKDKKLLKSINSKTKIDNDSKKIVDLEEIDWIEISNERKRHPEYWSTEYKDGKDEYDLILAVDCIYNEYLVQPLIDTLSKYCKRGKTVVWIVVELRSADVLTLFLESWINDPSGPWTIVRLNEDLMGDWDGKKARWVGWVGWR